MSETKKEAAKTQANTSQGKKTARKVVTVSEKLDRLEKCVIEDSKKLDAIEKKIGLLIDILAKTFAQEADRAKELKAL